MSNTKQIEMWKETLKEIENCNNKKEVKELFETTAPTTLEEILDEYSMEFDGHINNFPKEKKKVIILIKDILYDLE